MKSKWSTGKIVAVAGAAVGALMFILLAAFCTSFLFVKIMILTGPVADAMDETILTEPSGKDDEDNQENLAEGETEENKSGEKETEPEEDEEQEYFTEWENNIRDDLDYSIEWDTYEIDEEDNPIHLSIKYPVVVSDTLPNVEAVNNTIQKEITVLDDYLNNVKPYLEEGAEYEFDAEAYVIYMDEDVMSIVYIEKGDCAGTVENYLVAKNFNMKNGMAIPNSDLFQIDDDFVVDFRNRSNKQNGVSEEMDMMTDQEVEYYLTHENSVVAFYTPVGLEVGFNFPGGWATVTYKDYALGQEF